MKKMIDRKALIHAIELRKEISERNSQAFVDLPYEIVGNVIALLKEQEKQKFFVDESGKITPLPVVVRCKDCKKRYTVLCIQEEAGNVNNSDDWFCADGERKDI